MPLVKRQTPPGWAERVLILNFQSLEGCISITAAQGCQRGVQAAAEIWLHRRPTLWAAASQGSKPEPLSRATVLSSSHVYITCTSMLSLEGLSLPLCPLIPEPLPQGLFRTPWEGRAEGVAHCRPQHRHLETQWSGYLMESQQTAFSIQLLPLRTVATPLKTLLCV